MRKTVNKKKLNGEEKSPKNSGEVDSNGSLISDDISDHENDSPAKKESGAEESDGNKSDASKSDDSEEAARKVAKSKKLKKKAAKKSTKPKLQSDTEFEVDKVVGVKERNGKKLYQIRWKGYGKSDDTWEPEEELNCPAKITAYLEANPQEDAEDDEEEKKPKKKASGKETPGKKRKAGAKEKKKPKRAKAESSDEGEEETKEYEVEKIIEVHHKKNGKREYLVRWKGYSSKEDTWEPEAHLQCPELIAKFLAKVEKGKELGERELRVNPAHTEPYTLTMKSTGRRVSRRGDGKQRARYYEAE